jgi:hypothetical protein
MEMIMTKNHLLWRMGLSRVLPLLMLVLAGAGATAQTDPPARVGALSYIEGSVVVAPAGETEWTEAVLNRPVTRGDRLWTDHGARAELHLGSAALHVDGETFLDFTALDQRVLQASLREGVVNARVRELDAGENFEIDAPQLAFRAAQPGDYRIDVDPVRATTRVTVRSGTAVVYGASGNAQQLRAGQQVTFAGRDLERLAVQTPVGDGFDAWAADRNRREDESIAARHIPREVVGYHQLDPHGSWAHDPDYGAVWFPHVTVANWAPYRYGRWDWISPWGWTWIDNAPWGFAPFHYGRWTMIGSRWCWVPGRIGPRPVYAPALVAFLGGGDGDTRWNLTIGSGPAIGWYPLAPGEAWRPAYRASPVYLRNVNRNIFANRESLDSVASAHSHRRRVEAVTAIAVEDFSRGRPVHQHWRRVNPAELGRAPITWLPSLPEPRRGDGRRELTSRGQYAPPVPTVQPRAEPRAPAVFPREPTGGNRPAFGPRGGFGATEQRPLIETPRRQHERPPETWQRQRPRQGDEHRSVEEQRRQQERTLREQQLQAEAQRRQEEQRWTRQGQLQREHALRPQRAAAEERIRHRQQLPQPREQLRQPQAAHPQPQWQQRQPAWVAPASQPGPATKGEWRDRGPERRSPQEWRGERRPRGDEGGRGRGPG